MVDALIEDYEKSGVVDERREFLIKNAAGQIYGGKPLLFHQSVARIVSISIDVFHL